MKGGIAILLLLLAPAVAGDPRDAPAQAAFSWPQYYGGPTRDNFRTRGDAIDWPKVAWRVAGGRGQPTLLDGRVYTGGAELLAIDARSGRVLHRRKPTAPVQFAAAPVLRGRTVIARRQDGAILCLDRDLARVRWEHRERLPGGDARWRQSGVLVGDNYIYGERDRLHALNADTGKVSWSCTVVPDSVIRMIPASDGKRVFVGAMDGTFAAVDAKSGKIAWSHRQEGKYAWTNPVVFEGLVLIGDRGATGVRTGAVRCFGAKAGVVVWTHATGSYDVSTPGHFPGHAILGYGPVVQSFDLRKAEPGSFQVPAPPQHISSPMLVGKHVYFGNRAGALYCHDLNSGTLLWKFIVPLENRQQARVFDFLHTGKQIYVATSHGLYCLGQDPEKRAKRPAGALITP
ncbi:MAG: PQQ-binding-like beta-propeller repeat protein [Planctomycetota bacterium]